MKRGLLQLLVLQKMEGKERRERVAKAGGGGWGRGRKFSWRERVVACGMTCWRKKGGAWGATRGERGGYGGYHYIKNMSPAEWYS